MKVAVTIFTVNDFLNLEAFDNTKIMTGNNNLENIQIKFISVIEMPVENFIRKDELILTTAIGCYEDVNKFLSFIKEIYNSKAAALIISQKENNYYIPDEVKDFANSIAFPIIMIPWEYRFGEIIETVIYLINNDGFNLKQLYEKTEKNLLLSYINSKSLSDATQILYEVFGLPVVITNDLLETKGFCQVFKGKPNIENIGFSNSVKIKIYLNRRIYGYIFFFNEGEISKSDEIEDFIAKYAIVALTLWFDKEEAINDTVLKLKNDFIWKLVTQNISFDDETIMNGKRLGFEIKAPYTCIVCKIIDVDVLPEQEGLCYDTYFNIISIEKLILKKSKNLGKKIMYTMRNNILIIFMKNNSLSPETAVNSFIDNIEKEMKAGFPYYKFYWGISEVKMIDADFKTYYENAMFALNLCQNSKLKKHRAGYKETRIYGIISELSKYEEQTKMANKTLKELIDKSEAAGINLIETLKVYIENNYNVSQTARDLHIHRQSLLYRMKKIEDLTGMSLCDHDDLFTFEIYLRLLFKF